MRAQKRPGSEQRTDLDVSVQQFSRVHVLEGFEHLVHNILFVHLLQNVGSDHRMQIRFHVFKDKIQVLVILCLQYVYQPAENVTSVKNQTEAGLQACQSVV